VLILALELIGFSALIVYPHPTESQVATAPGTEEPHIENRYALLVGVEAYDEISSLNGPVRDICALREALISVGKFRPENIFVLARDSACGGRSTVPTKEAFLSTLGKLTSTMTKGDLFLLAFSGHGVVARNKSFLMFEDSRVSDVGTPENAFAVADLKTTVQSKQFRANHVVILLDACRNSFPTVADNSKLNSALVDDFTFNASNDKSVSILFSAGVSERSYIRSYQPISYFTWAVIKALLGEAADNTGKVRLADLAEYVKKEVPLLVGLDFLSGAGKNNSQHPTFRSFGAAGPNLMLAEIKSSTYNYTYTVEVVLKPMTAAKKSLSHQHFDIISPRLSKSLDNMFPLNVTEARPALAPITLKYSRGTLNADTKLDYLVRMTFHFGKWHLAYIFCPESSYLKRGFDDLIKTTIEPEGVLKVDATKWFAIVGRQLGDAGIEAQDNPPKAESETISECPQFKRPRVLPGDGELRADRPEQRGDVTILRLHGKVTGDGVSKLRSSLASLRQQGKRKILVDLGDVSKIDGQGLQALVSEYTALNRTGGQLKLLNLTRRLTDLLLITKLLTVFDVYDDEAEAVSSFR
jgi:anti-sigma B factor antagonist